MPEELYSTKREEIETEIFTKTLDIVKAKNIDLAAIFIRDVILPQTLRDAIEQKLKDRRALEYDFKIQKAQKKAERKEIEVMVYQNSKEL